MVRINLTAGTVIRAAAELVDEGGYDSLTLSSVARRLGVQTASLYGHVRDRAATLDGVRELALDELADELGAAIAGRAGRDALVGLAESQRSYAREHPGRWTALLRPFSTTAAPSPAAARLRSLAFAVLRGYDIPADEYEHAVHLLDATIDGFVELERNGLLGRGASDLEESWLRILTALDLILRSWHAVADASPAIAEGNTCV